MKDLQTKCTLMRCDSTGDRYLVTKPTSQVFISIANSLWNQHVGHPGHHVFQHLGNNQLMSCSVKKNSSILHACQMGKHVKLLFTSYDSVYLISF